MRALSALSGFMFGTLLTFPFQYTQFLRARAVGRVNGYQAEDSTNMGRRRVGCEIVLYQIRPARGSRTDDGNKHGQGEILIATVKGHN